MGTKCEIGHCLYLKPHSSQVDDLLNRGGYKCICMCCKCVEYRLCYCMLL